MLLSEDVISTIRMIQRENLDVRAVTMGVNLMECAGPEIEQVCDKVRAKIKARACRLAPVCDEVGAKYGIPVVNKRLAVSAISALGEGHGPAGMVRIAHALDDVAEQISVDLVGGYTALVQKGMTPGERSLIETLPEVLAKTNRVCASVNVASTAAGINMDAILMLGDTLKKIAKKTADLDGFGCAKLVIFANVPEDNPFMAGAYLGAGEPECVINIGVSGPGVVKHALQRLRESRPDLTLGDVAEQIKQTSFRVTRVGELIGREVARELDVAFGIVDLSLAPTPTIGDSVGEVLQAMGIARIGAPGTTAALAMLNDAVKKGGLFASSSVGGLSGAFIPVSEDQTLAAAVARGDLTIEKLEAMTAVCSVGLDMVVVPGATSADALAGIIADEVAIGVINNKTTAVRVIPAPGKKAGEQAVFGGLFGESMVMPVKNHRGKNEFLRRGGRIPAPLNSLKN